MVQSTTLKLSVLVLTATYLCVSGCRPPADADAPSKQPPPATSAADTSTPPPPVAAPPSQSDYSTAPPDQRQPPPPAAPTPPWSFPAVVPAELDNGLRVRTIERHTLPLVEVRLMLLSGSATDGNRPGLAVIAGEMLKVGGSGSLTSQQLLDQIESLGASLQISTGRDSTTISISVTSDQLPKAMDLLGTVVLQPSFNPKEFAKLKTREIDRVSSLAKSSAGWAANLVLFRELYRTKPGVHPYAAVDALPSQVERLGLWEVKTWAKTHLVPGNAILILAGDVTPADARAAAKKALGAWKGDAPRAPAHPTPTPPDGLHVYLVDRPQSPQAEVQVAMLGPERKSADWPAIKVANQVLGGGVSGRLFLDVREKQSLAYSTYSSVGAVAHGPGPLVLKAGTQTAKAGLALKALLDHAERISSTPASAEETAVATQYLADAFLLNMESIGDVASLVSELSLMDLPANYYDTYREQVRAVTPEAAQAAASKVYGTQRAIAVVSGDAERLAAPLSHFAPVTILDPNKDFKVVREVAEDPTAKIELPRLDGT